MRNSLFLVLLVILLTGCSGVKFSAYRSISSIEQVHLMQTDKTFSKALFDPRGRIIYAMDAKSAMVYVYRDDKLVNRIGGIGFDSSNFQRLSDIALDADGGLIVLDSMAKTLRKFTPEGKLISQMDLAKLVQPELVAISPEQDFFIYDVAPQEIVCISAMDGSELYRFGKFQSIIPTNLYCTRDYVVAYDMVKDLSYVYFLLGQHKENMPRQIVYDAFGNIIVAEAVELPEGFDAHTLPVTQKPGTCTLNREHVCAVLMRGIAVFRVNYQRGQM